MMDLIELKRLPDQVDVTGESYPVWEIVGPFKEKAVIHEDLKQIIDMVNEIATIINLQKSPDPVKNMA